MLAAPPSVKTVTNTGEQAGPSGNGAPVRVPPSRRYTTAKLLRIVADLKQRVLTTSYVDPLFTRPDVVEDDYYRFRNQPR